MDRITGMKLPLHYPERNGESGDRGVHWEKSETEIGETEKEGREERTHHGGSCVQQLRAQNLELGRTGLQIHAWTSYVISLWACY